MHVQEVKTYNQFCSCRYCLQKNHHNYLKIYRHLAEQLVSTTNPLNLVKILASVFIESN